MRADSATAAAATSRVVSADIVPSLSLSSAHTISVRLATSSSSPAAASDRAAPAVMIPPEHAAARWTESAR